MKLNKWIYGVLTLGIFASCSNDDVPRGEAPSDEPVSSGYIAVNLCLPTETGTRADDNVNNSNNDNFDGGHENEYAVSNGILVLFKGKKEDGEGKATYCGAYDLGFPKVPEAGDENGNVTVTYRRAVEVNGLNLQTDDRLYGLAILNYDQAGITFDKDNESGLKILKIPTNAGDYSCSDATTFEVLLSKASNKDLYKGDVGKIAERIFMTNSPLIESAPGGIYTVPQDVKFHTLVDLTDGLQISEEDALNNPAGTIYVERAVAKVQCSKFLDATNTEGRIATGLKITRNGSTEEETLYITNIEWGLGNNEENSYLVRNVDGLDWTLHSSSAKVTDLYRMVGSKGMRLNIDKTPDDPNNLILYRPYFGKDLHYDMPKYDVSNFNPEDVKIVNQLVWNGDQVFYPHENTFTVENQTYGNTTRVGFWVTYALGDDASTTFYTLGKDTKTFFFNDEEGNNPLLQYVRDDLSKNEEVIAAWKAALDTDKVGDPDASGNMQGSATFDAKVNLDIVIEIGDNGLLAVKSITYTDSDDYKSGVKPNFDFTNLIADFNSRYDFYEYKDGKGFYEVMIKHFGDDLTPWIDEKASTSISESYPEENRDNNYLGRYGLLRNNWYDLQVRKLIDLGDPRDPATWKENWDKIPDDNKPQYLAVRIAILSWAKRTQVVEF